jgi:predicted metallopeptidase
MTLSIWQSPRGLIANTPMDRSSPQYHRRDPPAEGFDFTGHVRRLCDDMVARLDQLHHIDMSRVAISFSQTRRSGAQGIFASLTPLRFADGQLHTFRRKRRWGIQRLYDPDGREMLYILTFYLPRFLDLPLREKLATVLHELWHVGPRFDGDVRRLGSRCFAHGASQKQYDAHVSALLDRWLSLEPPSSVYEFLQPTFRELMARHGRVYGRKVPAPKLVPLD